MLHSLKKRREEIGVPNAKVVKHRRPRDITSNMRFPFPMNPFKQGVKSSTVSVCDVGNRANCVTKQRNNLNLQQSAAKRVHVSTCYCVYCMCFFYWGDSNCCRGGATVVAAATPSADSNKDCQNKKTVRIKHASSCLASCCRAQAHILTHFTHPHAHPSPSHSSSEQ